MKNQSGLTLIELISVIVLVGIIATFTGYFLYTGINGYMMVKNNTEGALNAQAALDRITLELRNLDYFDKIPVTNQSIAYTTADVVLTGTRTLKYDSVTNTILIKTDDDYPLLQNVTDFTLQVHYNDMNNEVTENEVEYIEVGFKVNEVGKEFKTHVFPRHLVPEKK
jgi:prepilin-type N-terminal cleavage/methylation domain-containing protein